MEAEITAANPTMRPADKSTPAVIRIAPAPSAMIIRVEMLSMIFLKLPGSRKLTSLIAINSTSKNMTT